MWVPWKVRQTTSCPTTATWMGMPTNEEPFILKESVAHGQDLGYG